MKKHTLYALASLIVIFGVAATPVSATVNQDTVSHSRVHFLRHGASTNWSGYAVQTSLTSPQADAVTDVSGQWTVPAVSCAKRATNYSSIWVGIDGYSSNTVEQTGTEQDCSRGRPQYYAWFEMYPQASYLVNLAIAPGNVMSASVHYNSLNSYTLSLVNQTTGRSFSINRSLAGTVRQSAEWVVEAPSSWSGVLPLANFGISTITSASATINGHTGSISDAAWQNDPITMVTNGGTPKAIPSALSPDGSSFTVVWNHS